MGKALAPRQECVTENYFSYFSTKTYAIVTQKNRLNEAHLLSTHPKHIFKLVDKKRIAILRSKILLISPFAGPKLNLN